jgi:hypothetical protein
MCTVQRYSVIYICNRIRKKNAILKDINGEKKEEEPECPSHAD